MRKRLFVVALLLFAATATGQERRWLYEYTSGTLPACTSAIGPLLAYDDDGDLCSCDGTAWTLIDGGGGACDVAAPQNWTDSAASAWQDSAASSWQDSG